MKADHNTIKPFGLKLMSKYKVLSKHERGVIKNAQMTTLYTNWSLHITFTMIYYIRKE